MKETEYQRKLKDKIKERFPGCIVTKNDPTFIQGIPDLLILFGRHWATLETKRSSHEPYRPNQDYYVKKMNEMSFSSFIYPENEEEVLNAMEQSFKRRS